MRFIEICCGSAAVSLRLLGNKQPPVAYMGAKTRYASRILAALGLTPGQRIDEVVLVDAGPWAMVWARLSTRAGCRAVSRVLRSWRTEHPVQLWDRLASVPPLEDPAEAVAQYLWLQARSASCCPVWWCTERESWRMGDKPRKKHVDGSRLIAQKSQGEKEDTQRGTQKIQQMHARRAPEGGYLPGADGRSREVRQAHTGRPLYPRGPETNARQKGRDRPDTQRVGGIKRVTTVARRVEHIGELLHRWPGTLTVIAGDAALALDFIRPGDVSYFDPPYVKCTGYPRDLPRRRVLCISEAARLRGARMGVSETEVLPLAGWHGLQLAEREWLTLSVAHVVPTVEQVPLLLEAS